MTRLFAHFAILGALGLSAVILVHFAGKFAAEGAAGDVPDFRTYRMFADPDGVDPDPEVIQELANAIRQAQVPGDCPLGRLKIRVAEGDDLFQTSLVITRRNAILPRLEQRGAPVAGRLFVETSIFGGPEGHDTVYEIPRDRTPPTLQTNSRPPKSSKVGPGQDIVVTMTAKDEPYGPDAWNTGIKTIQLVADSEDGRFVASENYEPCSEPPQKRVEATYRVPDDPPPVVRLSAFAEDHAGKMSEIDRAEFPTGDFYGTFKFITPAAMQVRARAEADLVLNLDGGGNLTGTMVGQSEIIPATVGACSWQTIRPGRFRYSLVGSYTEGRSLKVFVNNVVDEAKLTYEYRCSGTSAPVTELDHRALGVWGGPPFLGTPSPLGDGEVQADGSRQSRYEANATWIVTLRRARD